MHAYAPSLHYSFAVFSKGLWETTGQRETLPKTGTFACEYDCEKQAVPIPAYRKIGKNLRRTGDALLCKRVT